MFKFIFNHYKALRPIAALVLVAFIFLSSDILLCTPQAYAQALDLPKPGSMVELTPAFSLAAIKGLIIHPDNPLQMDFLIDPASIDTNSKKNEYTKLVKYFLAALTIPEKDLWVNLSPYEKDRIIPNNFGQTQMGRDLLAQDYVLKQLTASLMYPEKQLGKSFWQKIYKETQQRFGTTDIPVNTFNKVWIVPDKAVVYEHGHTVFLVDSHLKVMLEEDYLALQKNQGQPGDMALAVSPSRWPSNEALNAKAPQGNNLNTLGSQIIRSIILPAIEKEVNEGKNFALLRQINNSLILATWYKKALKESLLGKIYADRNKTAGIRAIVIPTKAGIHNTMDVDAIYQRYLQAFKKGVYNYIKEEPDPITGETIPRKYFSGGYSTFIDKASLADRIQTTAKFPNFAMKAQVDRATIDLRPISTPPIPAIDFVGDLKKAIVQSDQREVGRLIWRLISADDQYWRTDDKSKKSQAQEFFDVLVNSNEFSDRDIQNILLAEVFQKLFLPYQMPRLLALHEVVWSHWPAAGRNLIKSQVRHSNIFAKRILQGMYGDSHFWADDFYLQNQLNIAARVAPRTRIGIEADQLTAINEIKQKFSYTNYEIIFNFQANLKKAVVKYNQFYRKQIYGVIKKYGTEPVRNMTDLHTGDLVVIRRPGMWPIIGIVANIASELIGIEGVREINIRTGLRNVGIRFELSENNLTYDEFSLEKLMTDRVVKPKLNQAMIAIPLTSEKLNELGMGADLRRKMTNNPNSSYVFTEPERGEVLFTINEDKPKPAINTTPIDYAPPEIQSIMRFVEYLVKEKGIPRSSIEKPKTDNSKTDVDADGYPLPPFGESQVDDAMANEGRNKELEKIKRVASEVEQAQQLVAAASDAIERVGLAADTAVRRTFLQKLFLRAVRSIAPNGRLLGMLGSDEYDLPTPSPESSKLMTSAFKPTRRQILKLAGITGATLLTPPSGGLGTYAEAVMREEQGRFLASEMVYPEIGMMGLYGKRILYTNRGFLQMRTAILSAGGQVEDWPRDSNLVRVLQQSLSWPNYFDDNVMGWMRSNPESRQLWQIAMQKAKVNSGKTAYDYFNNMIVERYGDDMYSSYLSADPGHGLLQLIDADIQNGHEIRDLAKEMADWLTREKDSNGFSPESVEETRSLQAIRDHINGRITRIEQDLSRAREVQWRLWQSQFLDDPEFLAGPDIDEQSWKLYEAKQSLEKELKRLRRFKAQLKQKEIPMLAAGEVIADHAMNTFADKLAARFFLNTVKEMISKLEDYVRNPQGEVKRRNYFLKEILRRPVTSEDLNELLDTLAEVSPQDYLYRNMETGELSVRVRFKEGEDNRANLQSASAELLKYLAKEAESAQVYLGPVSTQTLLRQTLFRISDKITALMRTEPIPGENIAALKQMLQRLSDRNIKSVQALLQSGVLVHSLDFLMSIDQRQPDLQPNQAQKFFGWYGASAREIGGTVKESKVEVKFITGEYPPTFLIQSSSPLMIDIYVDPRKIRSGEDIKQLISTAARGIVNFNIEFVSQLETFFPTKSDKAVLAQRPGGIDLNPAYQNLQIKRDGVGVALPLAQQDMAQLSRISGLTPVVVSITTVTDLPALLGWKK